MKTLNDVAKAYKKAAGKAIYPGVSYNGYKTLSSKAFATGNLLSKFVTSPQNSPDKIGRENKLTNGVQYTFVLDIAPTGADYGTYVHYGTSKMKARPFAEIATEDSTFIKVFDEFIEDKVDDVVLDYVGTMDSKWKTAGFEVS